MSGRKNRGGKSSSAMSRGGKDQRCSDSVLNLLDQRIRAMEGEPKKRQKRGPLTTSARKTAAHRPASVPLAKMASLSTTGAESRSHKDSRYSAPGASSLYVPTKSLHSLDPRPCLGKTTAENSKWCGQNSYLTSVGLGDKNRWTPSSSIPVLEDSTRSCSYSTTAVKTPGVKAPYRSLMSDIKLDELLLKYGSTCPTSSYINPMRNNNIGRSYGTGFNTPLELGSQGFVTGMPSRKVFNSKDWRNRASECSTSQRYNYSLSPSSGHSVGVDTGGQHSHMSATDRFRGLQIKESANAIKVPNTSSIPSKLDFESHIGSSLQDKSNSCDMNVIKSLLNKYPSSYSNTNKTFDADLASGRPFPAFSAQSDVAANSLDFSKCSFPHSKMHQQVSATNYLRNHCKFNSIPPPANAGDDTPHTSNVDIGHKAWTPNDTLSKTTAPSSSDYANNSNIHSKVLSTSFPFNVGRQTSRVSTQDFITDVNPCKPTSLLLDNRFTGTSKSSTCLGGLPAQSILKGMEDSNGLSTASFKQDTFVGKSVDTFLTEERTRLGNIDAIISQAQQLSGSVTK